MIVEMTKEYRTRDGHEVRLYAVNQSGPFPVHGAIRSTDGFWFVYGWTAEGKGRIDLPTHEWDLVEAPARVRNMIEIKEGPDLDRAIAGVIGMVCTHRVLGSDIEFYADPRAPREVPRTFNPSIDMNDAFYAGEATGLFTTERDGPEVHLAKTIDGQWEILTGATGWQSATVCGEMGYLTREATPALAICAAILKIATEHNMRLPNGSSFSGYAGEGVDSSSPPEGDGEALKRT